MIEPLEFIDRLRSIYPDRYLEMTGGCMKFHLLLKMVFPEAIGYYDHDHVITKIGENFYDIDGIVTETADFEPLSNFGEELISKFFGEYIPQLSFSA